MIQIDNKEMCTGCYGCAQTCPVQCIEMREDAEGFWYPEVDKTQCVGCEKCVKVCPVLSSPKWQKDIKTIAYGAYNKDVDARMQSSSGGIFALLAEYVIQQGGVVFGAAYACDYKSVEHICIHSKDEVYRLQGSKYVQSKVEEAYKSAKKYLHENKPVLFSGTPCQINGLYAFLGKEYNNLITQDIVCHGVPSPKVWKKWLDYKEKSTQSKIIEVQLRNKSTGWQIFSCKYSFENGVIQSDKYTNDLYMKNFMANTILRPSCYSCSFKGIERQADITLADFWGIERVLPHMSDNKGVSYVMLHSSKGAEIWREISENVQLEKVDVVNQYNTAAVCSVSKNAKRKFVMSHLDSNSIEKVLEKASRKNYIRAGLAKVRRLLNNSP